MTLFEIMCKGGVAFGTGEHSTTRLCLGWVCDKVERHLLSSGGDDDTSFIHFLDYGAGSGVLGIAAASIVRDYNDKSSIDTLDDEALSVVMKAMQRERNGDGSIRPIPEMLNMDNMYDLCAANILAAPLATLASTIARLVKSPGGEVGLSGILK